MVKVSPSVTLELKSGQTITIDLEEAQQIIRGLSKFVHDGSRAGKTFRPGVEARKKGPVTVPRMSEAKRNEILKHVNKKLSSKPRTLSNLLKGVSYVPNYLPAIRQMVEDQKHVSKKMIGKRTFYFLGEGRVGKPSKVAAAA
jgi:hypothetical protein